MSKSKPQEIPVELLKAICNLHEVSYLTDVRKMGNSALIRSFKKYIGKKAAVIICK